ncbi:putative protein kinase RLK-Pelle-LRR-XII-1 family [Helianthus annuus]|nr:putative protein kinase RLK-Pelle-LRR-XII-1 family [Helianthus annuus]
MSRRFMKVSYSQLLKATDGFSEANLIGNSGFSSVFTRECEARRNIRHQNLLKIITSCSSIDSQGNDFKALVYEFMPNGSLHDWLHSSETTSSPNLL